MAPLSREHHDGLLFVWKLRRGMVNGTDLQILAAFCSWYLKNHLHEHFDSEETLLLPYLEEEDEHRLNLLKEHEEIRKIIKSLDEQPAIDKVVQLGNLLEKHIRFEERTLFPYLEKILFPAQLQHVYEHLTDEPACSVEWKPEFWLNKFNQDK